MALALLIFGATFAAFCVWLSVRIINRRERWAKWTLTVVVALPVLYVLSFGPTCWVYSRIQFDEEWDAPDFIYAPILWTWRFDQGGISDAIDWYANAGAVVEVSVATKMNPSDSDPSFLTRIPGYRDYEPPGRWIRPPDAP